MQNINSQKAGLSYLWTCEGTGCIKNINIIEENNL